MDRIGNRHGGLRRLAVLVLAVAAAIPVSLAHAQEEAGSMSDSIAIVEEFVAAFNAKDVDRIMTFFADDAVYHNMPMDPVQGKDAIRRMIEGYLGPATAVDWEILDSAQSGATVFNERVDRFRFGDKLVELPVMGAFELRDGKIAAWRDYFDQATWTRQMGN